MLSRICKYVGHLWTTSDFSNSIKGNGERYAFKKRRECARCNKIEYLFENWENDADVDEKLKDHGLTKLN